MTRPAGLWMSLLLLGFVTGEKQINPMVVFSDGILLTVEGSSSWNSDAPTVLVMSSMPKERNTPDTFELVCLVRGLFNGIVDINWSVNGKNITKYAVVQASKETDGSYMATGLLSLPITEYSRGNNYSCTVRHGSKFYQGSTRVSNCLGST